MNISVISCELCGETIRRVTWTDRSAATFNLSLYENRAHYLDCRPGQYIRQLQARRLEGEFGQPESCGPVTWCA